MNVFNILIPFVLLIFSEISTNFSQALEFKHHNNTELEGILKKFTRERKKNLRTRLYQIGKSSKNIPLWVIELTGANNTVGVPNIKLIANIHGNEPVGREVLLHFIEYLRDNFEKDDRVTCLLENARIHILPSMNPDGYAVALRHCNGPLGRENGRNGEDLNRNFPDLYKPNNTHLQLETRAVMQWMDTYPFTLSAVLHGGAMVANYPYDTENNKRTSPTTLASQTPDNDVFVSLARTYADNHPRMRLSLCEDDKQPNRKNFSNGITNGAEWYSFPGSMSDYNYFAKGCMELTLEISCCKYPKESKLESLWEQNKLSLLLFSLEALKGVSGIITDAKSGKAISNATLNIIGRDMNFYSTERGEFWRLLLPGAYNIEVNAAGYLKKIVPFTVRKETGSCPRATRLEIKLINGTFSTNRLPTTSTIGVSFNDNGGRRGKSIDNKNQYLPEQPTTVPQNKKDKPSAAILNGKKIFPIPPEEEMSIFLMIFGPPRNFTSNHTEQEIRVYMMNVLNITDMTSFEDLLKDFDSKSPKEKATVIRTLRKILCSVTITFTHESDLRKYMKNKLKITNFAPYEKILLNFDKKDNDQRVVALQELLRIYNSQLLKNSGNIFGVHMVVLCIISLSIYFV